MKKVKIDGMILATFLTTLFYASTFPFIYKQLMMEVTDTLIALANIIECVSIIISGSIWNKWSDKLFPFYPHFCIAETVVTIGIAVWVLTSGHLAAYYMLSTIEMAIITRNMVCGGNRLQIIRYTTEKEREHYKNNDNSAHAAATIIGSCIAMVIHLPFTILLTLATFGNCVDNVMYLFIYYSTVKKNDAAK